MNSRLGPGPGPPPRTSRGHDGGARGASPLSDTCRGGVPNVTAVPLRGTLGIGADLAPDGMYSLCFIAGVESAAHTQHGVGVGSGTARKRPHRRRATHTWRRRPPPHPRPHLAAAVRSRTRRYPDAQGPRGARHRGASRVATRDSILEAHRIQNFRNAFF